jgi:excisionase family DNA binding protein
MRSVHCTTFEYMVLWKQRKFCKRVPADVLARMAEGKAVTLVPLHAELSTQQAAELMGMSHPYFIKLLEQGKMPFCKVGEQRRVLY